MVTKKRVKHSRCINCSLLLPNKNPMHIVEQVHDSILNILRLWVAPTLITLEHIICHECYLLIQECVNSGSTSPAPAFGHQNVCFICGISMLASACRVTPDAPQRSIILQRIPLHLGSRLDKVCHTCWVSATETMEQEASVLAQLRQELSDLDHQPPSSNVKSYQQLMRRKKEAERLRMFRRRQQAIKANEKLANGQKQAAEVLEKTKAKENLQNIKIEIKLDPEEDPLKMDTPCECDVVRAPEESVMAPGEERLAPGEWGLASGTIKEELSLKEEVWPPDAEATTSWSTPPYLKQSDDSTDLHAPPTQTMEWTASVKSENESKGVDWGVFLYREGSMPPQSQILTVPVFPEVATIKSERCDTPASLSDG